MATDEFGELNWSEPTKGLEDHMKRVTILWRGQWQESRCISGECQYNIRLQEARMERGTPMGSLQKR